MINFFQTSSPDIAKGLIYPIILLLLTSAGSGIRLYYLNIQGKNRYIDLLKINFSHIEIFFNTTQKFKRMSLVFSIEFLLLGIILGGLIALIIFIMLFFFSGIFDGVLIVFCSHLNNSYLNDLLNLSNWRNNFWIFVFLPILTRLPVLIILRAYRALGQDSIIEQVKKFVFDFIQYNKNVEELYELGNSQVIIYYLLWIFIGLILGLYFPELTTMSLNFIDPVTGITLSWSSSKDLLLLIFYVAFDVITFLGIISLGIHDIVNLTKKIRQFPNDVINPIKNYHQSKFPYIKIKTDFGEFKGQLKDIRTNSLSTINEKNIVSIFPWDTIKMMEACYQNECIFFDNNSKKDSSGNLYTI